MGLRSALHHLSWPAVAVALLHMVCSAALPVANKIALHQLPFPLPLTLALIQHASVALCLWFWSIFGLFRVRSPPPLPLLQLSLCTALSAAASTASLAYNTLLLHLACRLVVPPLLALHAALRARNPHALRAALPLPPVALSLVCTGAAAAALAHVDVQATPEALALAILPALVVPPLQLRFAKAALTIRASELQLQLPAHAASALLLAILATPLDGLWRAPIFDESATLLMFGTGLLAFCSFAAARAAVHRLPPTLYAHASATAVLPVFAAHFAVFDDPPSTVHFLAIALAMLGTFVLASASATHAERAAVRRARLFPPDTAMEDAFSDDDTLSDDALSVHDDHDRDEDPNPAENVRWHLPGNPTHFNPLQLRS